MRQEGRKEGRDPERKADSLRDRKVVAEHGRTISTWGPSLRGGFLLFLPALHTREISSSSSSSSSSPGFRDERTKEPRPRVEAERNETRFSLIRSTSYPQCGTTYISNARIHAYIYTRVYTSLSLALALLRLVRAGPILSYSLFLLFSLYPPPANRVKSLTVLF